MLITKLRAVGGSIMFAIPKSLLETLGFTANSEVGLSVADGKLVVEPRPGNRPHYTLAELMSQCDLSAPPNEETRIWLDAEPVGREVL